MTTFNFDIKSTATISAHFTKRRINSFKEACLYIRQLPYKRNLDKLNLATVFTDGFGTCSTKHALLKQLATENGQEGVKLKLGIFKMDGYNTPKIKHVIEKSKLPFIPEAHNYLSVNDERIDCTAADFNIENFVSYLITETEIAPEQITTFKIDYHKQILTSWLKERPEITLSLAEVWAIREACIEALAV
jgi:phosphopantetheinyl transferase (holo-ACP synthase)